MGKMNVDRRKWICFPTILIGAVLLGWFLLIVAYMLPGERIASNVNSGVETLLVEGAEFEYAPGFKASILDNQTEAIMLSETIYPTDNVIRDSLTIPMFAYEGRDTQELSLMAFLHNDTQSEKTTLIYPRYWHGYLFFSKAFFTFFDYSDSRIFHLGFQLLLIFCVLHLMYKRNLQQYTLPLVLFLILWNPASTGMCMQYYACFYITIIGSIVMLYKKDWLMKDKFHYYILFMVLGIVTSYLDFLTYPIATLGIPLTLWLLLYRKRELVLKQLITNSVLWAIGYVGMWFGKWCISSLVLKENIIRDALQNILIRTSVSVDEQKISRLEAVISLFSCLIKWPYIIFFGTTLVGLLIYYVYKYKKIKITIDVKSYFFKTLYPFFIVMLYPVAWIFLASNHSYIHPRLVYRIWGVSVFAFYSAMICFFEVQCNNDKRRTTK